MKIIFWGTPEYSVASLNNLLKSNYEVLAVVTQPDRKRSRGNKLIPSPVKLFALNENIPIFTPEKIIDNKNFVDELKKFSCDLFVVIAYGKIMSKEILEIPKFGAWNAHASLLPRWRGAAPIQWALIKGDDYTGVGIMKMEEGLDTGDLLIEEKIEIKNEDNFLTLSKKLSLLSSTLFIKAFSLLKQNIKKKNKNFLIKQSELGREIKYARMIEKSDYRINWEYDAVDIARKVKGLYPKLYTTVKGKNLKIIKIKIIKNHKYDNKNINYISCELNSGNTIGIIENEGIIISTKTDPIILLEAKLEGKNIASKSQLIQQLNPTIGERFSD